MEPLDTNNPPDHDDVPINEDPKSDANGADAQTPSPSTPSTSSSEENDSASSAEGISDQSCDEAVFEHRRVPPVGCPCQFVKAHPEGEQVFPALIAKNNDDETLDIVSFENGRAAEHKGLKKFGTGVTFGFRHIV